jgi:hypothetical protein
MLAEKRLFSSVFQMLTNSLFSWLREKYSCCSLRPMHRGRARPHRKPFVAGGLRTKLDHLVKIIPNKSGKSLIYQLVLSLALCLLKAFSLSRAVARLV